MCGIAGIVNLDGGPVDAALLVRMTDMIAHRGPDGEGHHTDGCVGLGHRRLAIIDLSPAGRQPMANETGDVLVVHNGEIYNFRELRVELEKAGHVFRSHTDTEVVIHAYEEWGAACLERFNGMFAFAIWDARRRRLLLARDRYGIKPLYWYCRDGMLIFASEVKAILTHPRVSRRVCHEALGEYFTFQNIFSDLTLFEGVRLLPPGTLLTLELGDGATPCVRRYWDYPAGTTADLTEDECVDRLYELFVSAVERQLVSDVPLGAYLSGGMDSASITSIAVRRYPRLATFTQGFDLSSASGLELGFDERRSAELLSNRLKTEHYEMVMHAGAMEWALPQLIWHLEDLRVGQSYPNFYVARLASRFVKVVLSGAGGDELFGGYPWRYYGAMNSDGRDGFLRRYYEYWQRLTPDEDRPRLFQAETYAALAHRPPFEVFRSVFDGWGGSFGTPDDYLNASLYFEFKTFLHGLLVVEDKLSMAHGLETRVPFLDDDLVAFACRVPSGLKVLPPAHQIVIDENLPGKRRVYEMQMSNGKAVLRKAMARFIPPEITERAKQGFSAPDASWFRGESIDYINTLLRDPRARIFEFLDPAYVTGKLDEHTSGRANRRLFIWSLLSFEWWLRAFMGDTLAPPQPTTSA